MLCVGIQGVGWSKLPRYQVIFRLTDTGEWNGSYLKTMFPALSAFQALTRAKSPVMAFSMM